MVRDGEEKRTGQDCAVLPKIREGGLHIQPKWLTARPHGSCNQSEPQHFLQRLGDVEQRLGSSLGILGNGNHEAGDQ